MSGEKQSPAAQRYLKLVERITPKSKLAVGLLRAFWVGGVVCIVGQLITDGAKAWFTLSNEDAAMFATIVLVFLAGLLTGIGVFDNIGKYAGAGTIVPITGFSNSIVASAMEFRREGLVMGVGAKLFLIAGPVLVYGIGSSVIAGLIAFFVGV